MDYRVCQSVEFEKWDVTCRGGPAAMCWHYTTADDRVVCGAWRASEQDAYASFYTTMSTVTDCSRPGSGCIDATPIGEPELRTSGSGALKLVGANEKSVGDSILGVINMILSSFRING